MPSSRTELKPEVLATIDVGTNSVLMQVTTLSTSGALHVIDDFMTITRLGQGVDRTRRLHDDAIARTLDALREYAGKARSHGARVLAVGTSALRDAKNGADFLAAARDVLGAPLEVISGEREALLTFLGATEGLSHDVERLCVVDVGGGSTEIVVGTRSEVSASTSLDIGAVRLFERHGLKAPASRTQLQAIVDDVARALDTSDVAPCAPLVAIAGTATTLAAIHGAVDPYDPARIHGSRLSLAEIDALIERLSALSLAERREIPGLDARRADVIVAGALVLAEVVRRARAPEIIVSNGGVRTGLAALALRNFEIDPSRSLE